MGSFNQQCVLFSPLEAETQRYRCRSGKCTKDSTHWTYYDYVTGRAGRVSNSRKPVCSEHARLFCKRNALEYPNPAEAPDPLPRHSTCGRNREVRFIRPGLFYCHYCSIGFGGPGE